MTQNNSYLRFTSIIIGLLFLLMLPAFSAEAPGISPDLMKEVQSGLDNLPFDMPAIQPPVFPEQIFNITAFGAVGDGHTKNTVAINQAILKCTQSGGGTVIIPSGIWLTGPIELQSNVNLHLESGALVIFSRERSDYPIIKPPGKSFTAAPPISGYNLENIAITGEGVFDGNGEAWRPVKRFKTTSSQWRQLIQSGGIVAPSGDIWWPSPAALHGEKFIDSLESVRPKGELVAEDYLPARDYLRPDLVSLINCKTVLIDGPTFKNSPKYALQPERCQDIIIRNVKVNNEWWAQNGDGIDINSCKNVLIQKCTLTTGDDALCMKASRRRGQSEPAVQNIVIRDCSVYRGHGGFVIGSNTDGGMRNIFVNNCIFIGTDVGLRFKSARDRGGLVENIIIRNIYMKDIVNESIFFNTYYENIGREIESRPVTEDTPIFRNFILDSIFCVSAKQAVSLVGLPEMPISQIRISNSYLAAEIGFSAEYTRAIRLGNFTVVSNADPVFRLFQCRDFNLEKIGFASTTREFMHLSGKNTQAIRVKNTPLSSMKKPLVISKEVDDREITLE